MPTKPQPKPKIGIVSGTGAAAGADVFTKLVAYTAHKYHAKDDVDYPDVVLINHGIDGVDNAALAALSNDTFKNAIVKTVAELEAAGANIIGIACNTAHLYLPDLKVQPGTTLIDLIDEVAKKAAAQGGKYLLLSSAGTREQKLYHKYLDRHNVKYAEVNDAQQALLDQAIGLVMGYSLDQAGALLDQVMQQATDDGFTAVIAGCTELPIAIEHADAHGLTVLDSNSILAAALTDQYFKSKKSQANLS